MSNTLTYFRFNIQDWTDGDIADENHKTKGVFMDVCSFYFSRVQKAPVLKEKLLKRFNNNTEEIEILFDEGYLKIDKKTGVISIAFLDKQLAEIIDTRPQRTEAGRRGGLAKAANFAAKKSAKRSKPSKSKPSTKTPEYGTVDGKKVTQKEVDTFHKYQEKFNACRKLAFDQLNEDNNKPPSRVRNFKFDQKAKSQSIKLIREGITPVEFDSACTEAFFDDYHQENNLKFVTPEYITRDNVFGKFLAVSETQGGKK